MSDALACRDRKKESAADKRRWTPILFWRKEAVKAECFSDLSASAHICG